MKRLLIPFAALALALPAAGCGHFGPPAPGAPVVTVAADVQVQIERARIDANLLYQAVAAAADALPASGASAEIVARGQALKADAWAALLTARKVANAGATPSLENLRELAIQAKLLAPAPGGH